MEQNQKFVIRCRAVIIHEGKLLAVKHRHEHDYLALPGGHLEWGEDIKTCMKREITEELGVEPEIGHLLYVNTFIDASNIQSIEFFFEVLNGKDYLNTEELFRSHAHEINKIIWASPTDDIKILPQKFADDFKDGKFNFNEVQYISDF